MERKNRDKILIINAGSSSLKFKLYTRELTLLVAGQAEKIGQAGSFLKTSLAGKERHGKCRLPDQAAALREVFCFLEKQGIDLSTIGRLGHRVVHGGEKFVKPLAVGPAELTELRGCNKLAPLHNPHNLLAIEYCLQHLPWAKNYAAFDTAFHATMPDYVYLYPLPYAVYRRYHIRKYGFHGLSHQYVSEKAAKILKKPRPNLITCHLGSGCSITAVKAGRSFDTSMGFTPLEGLMMMTRSGDIDPSIPLFLHEQGLGSERIRRLLNFESGLSGVAQLKDMRDIMLANGYKIPGYRPLRKINSEHKYLAKLALQMFVYRARKYIGAYASALGRVDALVFTAGIGERNADVRGLIARGLPFKTRILVVPTDEELQIARLIAKSR